MGIRLRDHPIGIGVCLLQDLFLLLLRLMEKVGGGTAHLRIQTGDASLSGLQFRQLFQADGQFLIQLGVFPMEGIYRIGQKVYVLIHLSGGVAANGTAELAVSDFLRQ